MNVAFAARDVALPSYVRSEIPELGIKAEGLAPAPAMPASASAPMSIPPASASSPLPTPGDSDAGSEPTKKGCLGCAMAETQARNDVLALTAAALAIFVLRRRRAP